jgi:hypothetical protein
MKKWIYKIIECDNTDEEVLRNLNYGGHFGWELAYITDSDKRNTKIKITLKRESQVKS